MPSCGDELRIGFSNTERLAAYIMLAIFLISGYIVFGVRDVPRPIDLVSVLVFEVSIILIGALPVLLKISREEKLAKAEIHKDEVERRKNLILSNIDGFLKAIEDKLRQRFYLSYVNLVGMTYYYYDADEVARRMAFKGHVAFVRNGAKVTSEITVTVALRNGNVCIEVDGLPECVYKLEDLINAAETAK